jgi:glycosyltransferase involved in cell wall biosynthesis
MEGYVTTGLEAMASGTPVIVTDSAGVSEAVIDHTTGIILEPNPSADKISLSLKKLIKDKSTLDEYSSSARKHVCKNFSPHIISGQIESLYNSL